MSEPIRKRYKVRGCVGSGWGAGADTAGGRAKREPIGHLWASRTGTELVLQGASGSLRRGQGSLRRGQGGDRASIEKLRQNGEGARCTVCVRPAPPSPGRPRWFPREFRECPLGKGPGPRAILAAKRLARFPSGDTACFQVSPHTNAPGSNRRRRTPSSESSGARRPP